MSLGSAARVNLVLRELTWLAAWAAFAYVKNPAGAAFWPLRPGPIATLGVGLVAAGLVGHVWSAVSLGRAISGAVTPTTSLVAYGPFRVVRNPIYLTGAAVFVGIYLLYAAFSVRDLIAAIVVGALLHLYVVRFEEPATRKRLGAPYEEYCRRVPRWIPRLS